MACLLRLSKTAGAGPLGPALGLFCRHGKVVRDWMETTWGKD